MINYRRTDRGEGIAHLATVISKRKSVKEYLSDKTAHAFAFGLVFITLLFYSPSFILELAFVALVYGLVYALIMKFVRTKTDEELANEVHNEVQEQSKQ